MISERLKAAHSRRDSQHLRARDVAVAGRGRGSSGDGTGVPARALQLHRARPGCNVGRQKWQ